MLFYLTLFYVVICYLYYMCFFVNWIVDMRMDGQALSVTFRDGIKRTDD